GTLNLVLLILLILVTLSGILGVELQQILPRMMTSRVTMETIHDQIDHVLAWGPPGSEGSPPTIRSTTCWPSCWPRPISWSRASPGPCCPRAFPRRLPPCRADLRRRPPPTECGAETPASQGLC